MYIALDSKGNIVNVLELSVEKGQEYFCPHCKKSLLYKKGRKIQSHFAHKKKLSCSYNSYKSESKEHLLTKKDFYDHFKRIYSDVKLEYIFKADDNLQIADIYLVDKNIAFEYQRSIISSSQIKERTIGYEKAGIKLIWLIDLNKFVKEFKLYNNIAYIRYAAFVENFLNYHKGCVFFYGYDLENKQLVFYQIWPNRLKKRHAVAIKQVCKLENFRLPLNFKFSKKNLINKIDRSHIENYLYVQLKFDKTVKNKVLSLFYNSRIALNDIPEIIGIPSVEDLLVKTPIFMWQTKVYKMYKENRTYVEILKYMYTYMELVDSIYLSDKIKAKIIEKLVKKYYIKLVKI
ncbi:competence protein [Gemella sp. 19428wG2_WT2a]|nr:competence protein [Gemella sp. 19428wG2_WT2a]TFU58552.1 competence protein [Gemella sp. WT2a]